MKYTAIYVDSWLSGSHMNHITRMRRMEKRENETVADMLEREGLETNVVFLFHGHPSLQGEDQGQ